MADDIVERLEEKCEQRLAALRSLQGLPILVTESDTAPGKSAMWMDNGLAGCGQVSISTGEFPCCQTEAVAALANIAANTDFANLVATITTLRTQLAERDAKLAKAREALGGLLFCSRCMRTITPRKRNR